MWDEVRRDLRRQRAKESETLKIESRVNKIMVDNPVTDKL